MHKILVSACLLGETVRYDGKSNLKSDIWLQQCIAQARVISFCPEVSAGMSVPRSAAEIVNGDGYDVLSGDASVIDNTGINVSDKFIRGAEKALAQCQRYNIRIAILAQRSPSCGNKTIYDGSFSSKTRTGPGVTAALLTQNEIQVFNQTELIAAADYLKKLDSQ